MEIHPGASFSQRFSAIIDRVFTTAILPGRRHQNEGAGQGILQIRQRFRESMSHEGYD